MLFKYNVSQLIILRKFYGWQICFSTCSGGTEWIFWIFVRKPWCSSRKKPWCQNLKTSKTWNLRQGFAFTLLERSKCRPTTSAERVLVQTGSPPSAYSAREQRQGELSVALERHLAQDPHGIDQSGLANNRSNVPESGTAPNCCAHEKVAKALGKYYQAPTSWH